ncbi:MAG TPA: hypothetical protein VL336_00875 [Sphingomicrobium sp.]|nr:hypothetical protein [Sphingomicrobium sp.]
MAIDIAHAEYLVAAQVGEAAIAMNAIAIELRGADMVAATIFEHRLTAVLVIVGLTAFEPGLVVADSIVPASLIVILDEAGLPGMALVAATVDVGSAELTMTSAPAAIEVGGVDLTVSTAAIHMLLAFTASAIGAGLLLAAPAATAVGANLLATLALSAVPALFGADRRGDCQRGRAGGKHPFHHGISPS